MRYVTIFPARVERLGPRAQGGIGRCGFLVGGWYLSTSFGDGFDVDDEVIEIFDGVSFPAVAQVD